MHITNTISLHFIQHDKSLFQYVLSLYAFGISLINSFSSLSQFLPAEHIGIDVSNIPLCTDRDFMEDIDLTNDFEVMAVQNVYC